MEGTALQSERWQGSGTQREGQKKIRRAPRLEEKVQEEIGS